MAIPSFTRMLAVAHRWLALILAPVFLLILLSGAILAFKPIVNSLAGPSTPVDPVAVVTTLERIDPAHNVTALQRSPDGQSLTLQSHDTALAGTYDLATGALTDPSDVDVFTVALNLHKNLLIGARFVVEIATYAMVGILLVGLLLGWPKLRNTLMGWHSGLAWLALPLVILTPVTGVMMLLHIGTPTLPRLERGGPPLPLAQAITVAADQVDLTSLSQVRRFRQGNVLLTVTPPTAESQRYLVTKTGQVTPLAGPGLVRELHEGTWAGAWSGALNFLAAIALMALTGTGLYSWLRRARQTRRRSGDANASTLVAYASQTGTAARLAEATAQALRQAGEAVVCASLAALDPRELTHFQHNLLIVSTTGEGEVPDPARPFLQRLGTNDLKLNGARFNLLALGDSRYATFCGGGQKLRTALLEHGAREAATWQRADGEPTATWRDWLNSAAGLLGLRLGTVEAPETDRPISLTLVERERLDDPHQGDTRETWRLRFALDQTGLDFRPGDLVLISPVAGATPRCYSIGSSSRIDPRQFDLTVSLHQWQDAQGHERLGLASHYLCRELQLGTKITAQWRRHPEFNPTVDASRPLILVATGAGIAPFPGFLAERAQQESAGPVWLLFGNRHRQGDFFYRNQLEGWQQQGALTRLDTAFSRDAGDGHYIQDRLTEHGAELLRWLAQERGTLYTCGRAGAAGAAVEQTLRELLVRYGSRYGLPPDETLARWRADGTLRFDVFG